LLQKNPANLCQCKHPVVSLIARHFFPSEHDRHLNRLAVALHEKRIELGQGLLPLFGTKPARAGKFRNSSSKGKNGIALTS
jgi:hypothetical protein